MEHADGQTDRHLDASAPPATPPLARRTSMRRQYSKSSSAVGSLCRNLPDYVRNPPIEAVVFGWGVAEDGQLGFDTTQDVSTPKVIEALLGTRLRGREFIAQPLVASSRNTLAIDGDGQVLSWGWNARATLGHGFRSDAERKPRRVAALVGVPVAQAAVGGWHVLAVDVRGQAYAWGGNEYGQCGVGRPDRDVATPARCVPHLRVVQVAAGGMHSCVLTELGEVWTWGEPWGDFSMHVNREPCKVAGASDIAKIACGAFHNLALNWAGEVFAWGINDFGQLGNGSTFYATAPAKVAGLAGLPIADIAAGGWHSLAITTEGDVYVWGRGEYGRLGLGDRGGSSRLRPTRVRGLEGHCVVQASAGGTHTAVLTHEGRIFAWGRGSFGRLGTGATTKDAHSPVEVLLPGGPERWRVISLACGGRHTVALALPDNGENGPSGRAPLLSVSGASPTGSSVAGASEEEVGANLDNCLDQDDEGDEDLVSAPENGGSLPHGLVAQRAPSLLAALEREEAAADAEAEAAEAEASVSAAAPPPPGLMAALEREEAAADAAAEAEAAAAPPRQRCVVEDDDNDVVGSPDAGLPPPQAAVGAAAVTAALAAIHVRR